MIQITPNPNCPYCHGSGTVYDSVDYGSTTVSMPSDCDCVLEQLPEDCEDFEIVSAEPEFEQSMYDNVYEKYADLWELER